MGREETKSVRRDRGRGITDEESRMRPQPQSSCRRRGRRRERRGLRWNHGPPAGDMGGEGGEGPRTGRTRDQGQTRMRNCEISEDRVRSDALLDRRHFRNCQTRKQPPGSRRQSEGQDKRTRCSRKQPPRNRTRDDALLDTTAEGLNKTTRCWIQPPRD